MNTFIWKIRVYWEDTDAGGVVFYANYLKFFERARTEWIRAMGVSQHTMAEETGAVFIVRHTEVGYLAPARLDDHIEIRSRMERIGGASVVFVQEAWRGEQCLSQGTIKVGCVDKASFKPTPVPKEVMQKIKAAAGATN